MIRLLIGIIFIFSSYSVFAQVTLESCSLQAVDNLNSNVGGGPISEDCISLIEAQRNETNSDFSSDNFVEITAYKNILFTKEYGLDPEGNTILIANRFTAGSDTKITDILALDFNEADATIYVLNKNGSDHSILTFYYNVNGNIDPLRIHQVNDLNFATNLDVDEVSKRVHVISQSQKWIKSFHKEANPLGKKAKNSTDVVNTISGAATQISYAIDIGSSATELFVLDNDKILVFNKSDSGSIAPKRVIFGPNTKLVDAKALKINADGNIEITNGDGKPVIFPINGNGNIFPL